MRTLLPFLLALDISSVTSHSLVAGGSIDPVDPPRANALIAADADRDGVSDLFVLGGREQFPGGMLEARLFKADSNRFVLLAGGVEAGPTSLFSSAQLVAATAQGVDLVVASNKCKAINGGLLKVPFRALRTPFECTLLAGISPCTRRFSVSVGGIDSPRVTRAAKMGAQLGPKQMTTSNCSIRPPSTVIRTCLARIRPN